MSHICCFTGYRPHRFAFSPEGVSPERIADALAARIRTLYGEGCRIFITGMCAGVDLWAADGVLALQREYPEVALWAAVPFQGQESRWPQAVQKKYHQVLAACQRVEVLFDEAAARADAAACYRARNRWMVDEADTVLAVFAPEYADRRSGTAATVRYARTQQKRLLYIHPNTLAVSEETIQQMAFEL